MHSVQAAGNHRGHLTHHIPVLAIAAHLPATRASAYCHCQHGVWNKTEVLKLSLKLSHLSTSRLLESLAPRKDNSEHIILHSTQQPSKLHCIGGWNFKRVYLVVTWSTAECIMCAPGWAHCAPRPKTEIKCQMIEESLDSMDTLPWLLLQAAP